MLIRLEGDHSAYHCGSQAAFSVLTRIWANKGRIVEAGDGWDTLVVNGEGSMHHGSSGFHTKMLLLREAQAAGKSTYLVNSVWQANPADYDDVLRRLDGFYVRGRRSVDDLRERHGIAAEPHPDLAYWADSEGVATDMAGGLAMSDMYAADLAGFVFPSDKWLDAGRIDMKRYGWADLVATLKTTSIFITGRHHGMYAACKARTPFVIFQSNSHKLEDLFSMAGVNIPICRTFADARKAIRWSVRHPEAYARLFDWMEAREPPRL